MARYVETCVVANQHCEHPANLDPPTTARAICWNCEQHVCTAKGCSLTTTKWPLALGKKVRICATCCEEHIEFARRIDADIYLECDYPEYAREVRAGRAIAPWRRPWNT